MVSVYNQFQWNYFVCWTKFLRLVGTVCIVIVRLDKIQAHKANVIGLVIGIGHQQLMLAIGKSPY